MDNNQNAHEDSLSEKYKNLFAEFEKHGQDISDGFKKFGGKEAFL